MAEKREPEIIDSEMVDGNGEVVGHQRFLIEATISVLDSSGAPKDVGELLFGSSMLKKAPPPDAGDEKK